MLWVILGVVYFVALVWLGLATLRNGHWVLFAIGIIFPILWIFGAFMAPRSRAGTV